MEAVIKVAIGALIIGFGSIIFAIVIYFFLPLWGITAQPVSNDWGLVLSIIGGVIMFFLYLFFHYQSLHRDEIREQKEEAKRQRELISDVKDVMFDIKASIDTTLEKKIEAQIKKDNQQDGKIEEMKSRMDKLENRVDHIELIVKEIKGQFVDLKKYIGDTIGALKKVIEKSGL